MRVISFISQLSLTNVGKSGTHDYYLFFPKKDDEVIQAFFTENQSEEFDVIDKETGEIYEMKVTFPRKGAECRIVKDFGLYVRNKNLDAGDEVILEKRFVDGENPKYVMDYIKYEKRMILRYHKKAQAYYTWHQERFQSIFNDLPQTIQIKDRDEFINVEISFKDAILLRSDAKEETPVYRLDGVNHFSDQKALKEIILERENDGTYRLYKPFEWKFHDMETGI